VYEYTANSLIINEEYSRYEETLEELFSGLEDQVEPENVDSQQILEDEDIEISESVFEGEVSIEPMKRYRVEELGERRTVYIFDRSLGLEVVGDYAMIREAVPDYVPDSVIPMQKV